MTARPALAWLAALFAGCAAPAGLGPEHAARGSAAAEPRAPDSDHSRAATLDEQLAVRKLMRATERLRGLRFVRPVELRVEDRQGMRAYVSRALDEQELARSRRRYVALGLVPDDLDVRALLEDLLEDELVGYYDAETKRMVVRDELARALARGVRDDGALAFAETVVHELVHALQDQHLGLGARLHAARTTDADNAYAALVEGDAQLTMLAYALAARGHELSPALIADPELQRVLNAPPRALGERMQRAPALVREPLLFRYRAGTRYAAHLYEKGGFLHVDAAHAAPPQRTRTILVALHERSARDAPAVPLPRAACTGALGFELVDDDSLGSLEAGVALADLGASLDVLADRYEVLAQGSALASLWSLRLGSNADARTASSLLARGEPDRFVVSKGSSVLAVRGLPSDCAASLAAAFAATRDAAPTPAHPVDRGAR